MSSKGLYRIKIHSFAAFVLVGSLVMILLGIPLAQAAELQPRSIYISSSYPSEVVSHAYSFSTAGPSTIGSIGFEYCTNTPLHDLPCTAPSGLDVSAFNIDSELGLSGFTVSTATTANMLAITRSPVAEPASSAIFSFDNIVNPSNPNEITYVRISLFDSQDLGGSRVDRGSVVFVTEDPYAVSAYVPPFLEFCVGITVAADCSKTSGFLVALGELTETEPALGTSQVAAATNDGTGYNLFLGGRTMTSGNNVIPALPTKSNSSPGTSQFGVNLRANSNPAVGSDPQTGGPVANAVPDSRYNTPNKFRFVNGDRIAGSTRSTNYNRFTVSYLVNVSVNQPPGKYAATFTYTAIASF